MDLELVDTEGLRPFEITLGTGDAVQSGAAPCARRGLRDTEGGAKVALEKRDLCQLLFSPGQDVIGVGAVAHLEAIAFLDDPGSQVVRLGEVVLRERGRWCCQGDLSVANRQGPGSV